MRRNVRDFTVIGGVDQGDRVSGGKTVHLDLGGLPLMIVDIGDGKLDNHVVRRTCRYLDGGRLGGEGVAGGDAGHGVAVCKRDNLSTCALAEGLGGNNVLVFVQQVPDNLVGIRIARVLRAGDLNVGFTAVFYGKSYAPGRAPGELLVEELQHQHAVADVNLRGAHDPDGFTGMGCDFNGNGYIGHVRKIVVSAYNYRDGCRLAAVQVEAVRGVGVPGDLHL